MDGQEIFDASYRGSKRFTQWDVATANATGFGAAADDYAERGVDLNEQVIKNKPGTFCWKNEKSSAPVFGGFTDTFPAPAAFCKDGNINAVNPSLL